MLQDKPPQSRNTFFRGALRELQFPSQKTENTTLHTGDEAYGNYLAFRNRDPRSKHGKQRIFIKLVTVRHFRCAACFGEATRTCTERPGTLFRQD